MRKDCKSCGDWITNDQCNISCNQNYIRENEKLQAENKKLTEQHHLDLDTIANLTPSKTLDKDNVSLRLRYNKAVECLSVIATEGSRPNWAGNLAKKCLAEINSKIGEIDQARSGK
jgi:translation initiation factor 2B subunit (eIF-2B alpha/beta/delta family)